MLAGPALFWLELELVLVLVLGQAYCLGRERTRGEEGRGMKVRRWGTVLIG